MKPLWQDYDWMYHQYIILDKNYSQIAREQDVHNTTIREWARKFNIHKPKPLYQNRGWLYHQIVVLNKCQYEIAKGQDTTSLIIWYWANKFNIHKPKPKLLYQDPIWLNRQYWNLEKCDRQIAKEQGVSRKVIYSWRKRFDIKSRDKSHARHLTTTNHVKLTSELLQILEGELLGDGCLIPPSKWSALHSHSSKHEQYCKWLSSIFNILGIKQCGNINTEYHTECIRDGYHWPAAWTYQYHSLSYAELRPIHQRWYRLWDPKLDSWRNRKTKYVKIVPKNIELTPTRCLHWYLGDGSLSIDKQKNYCGGIVLATCDFSVYDAGFLTEKLNNLGFECIRSSRNTINIHKISIVPFLDYIGPCPKEARDVYGYKWELP